MQQSGSESKIPLIFSIHLILQHKNKPMGDTSGPLAAIGK